jgi:ferritin
MRVWKQPEQPYEYVMGVDVAMGRDRDYSAFHIINQYTGEQVAEFYSNKTPINEFATIIYNEANLYNNALVIVETEYHRK